MSEKKEHIFVLTECAACKRLNFRNLHGRRFKACLGCGATLAWGRKVRQKCDG